MGVCHGQGTPELRQLLAFKNALTLGSVRIDKRDRCDWRWLAGVKKEAVKEEEEEEEGQELVEDLTERSLSSYRGTSLIRKRPTL